MHFLIHRFKAVADRTKDDLIALGYPSYTVEDFHETVSGVQRLCKVRSFLGPVYTTTNTQRIAIYPGKFKFILVKISPDSEGLHGRHAKENQTLVTFLTT